jgi:hypothetical protein
MSLREPAIDVQTDALMTAGLCRRGRTMEHVAVDHGYVNAGRS